jgi:type I restriction enzyme M protein
VSWRDPEAAPIVSSITTFELETGAKPEDQRTYYSVISEGGGITYEPDSELRDTENIPLLYPGGIEAYFHREVLPHVPDAWIDEEKTVIGYEISFNKYFYVHQPLRDLAEVVKEIRDLEAETEGLLEQILNFSSSGH